MSYQVLTVEQEKRDVSKVMLRLLPSRADEVLISVATLGLVATIADGQSDYREAAQFAHQFRRRFGVARRRSLRIISSAFTRIGLAGERSVVDEACGTINDCLGPRLKFDVVEGLAEVLISDGKVHQGEKKFLDYIAFRLGIFL